MDRSKLVPYGKLQKPIDFESIISDKLFSFQMRGVPDRPGQIALVDLNLDLQ